MESMRETKEKLSSNTKLKSKKQLQDLGSSVEVDQQETFTAHEEMLGKEFTNQKLEVIPGVEVYRTPLICLFFTGLWCNPCQFFAKDLIEVYNEANQGIKTMEIIQITLEKDFLPGERPEKIDEIRKEEETKFKVHIADKPWVFINYIDERNNQLKEKYKITSVPAFFVLKRDLSILTDEGRKEIANEGYNIAEKWLKSINYSQ